MLLESRYIANEVTHAAMEPHSTLASFEIDSADRRNWGG